MLYADGTVGHISVQFFIIKDADGKTVRTYGVNQDITERKKMEERLRQAQKMESIGTLAGGIAHDFNNILFPIVGMAELLLEDLPQESILHENAREILKAGKRGSDLIRQILTFSRQSEKKKIPVRFQQVLKEALKLCRSTIPSNIDILPDIQEDCDLVMADPTQLHQIVMNLTTNAYHALENTGGTIAVQLREVSLKRQEVSARPLKAGKYVKLSVSDTGRGIDPAIKDKIFEPYFSTKQKQKGTGLGLAVVYGIIKEHQGDISVYSEVGKGTTFNVYLPIIEKTLEAEPTPKEKVYLTGHERILMVDDEAPIAQLEKQMLERLGYQVTALTSSTETLKIFKAGPDAFDLVITDMTMPNMTGEQLAQELLSIRPDIPVIISTGFSKKLNSEQADAMGIKAYLLKPVTSAQLMEVVRKVLDEAKGLMSY